MGELPFRGYRFNYAGEGVSSFANEMTWHEEKGHRWAKWPDCAKGAL